jgi:uncharacterized protein YcbX
MISLSELYIYPVKSLAGIKLKSSKLTPFGLEHDRRWMIVDKDGKFLSQREVAKMATMQTTIVEGKLILSYKQSKIKVPAVNHQSKQILVTVWKDTFEAAHVSTEVDEWLTDILGQTCQLVYMHKEVKRQVDLGFAPKGQNVSFADGFPILVISQASLDDLNSRLDEPVNINRFRANFIVTGTDEFAEDNWHELSINKIEYQAVKTCSRCIIPSINQQTGVQDKVNMLATLNRYRKIDNKIKFGQNLIYKNVDLINQQSISCGDEIILKKD